MAINFDVGDWTEACIVFEKVISTADRNALPWWLRYSQGLLETGRGMEAVAFLQRVINRFPNEVECKAFAAALYTSLGTKVEAARYWKQLTPDDRLIYSNPNFTKETLKWGPKAITNLALFLDSKYAVINDEGSSPSI